VDTKSINNTTLLHFLERTVSKQFPDMESFLDELEKPAEAYRGARMSSLSYMARSFRGAPVNLLEVRKGLTELRDGYKRLRKELDEHHADGESSFAKKMWSFSGKAGRQLEDLVDDVNAAEVSFSEVARYYGEDEKNVNSSEFYGIFKTFVTSYSV
jgi:cytokinesis protein